MRNIGRAMSSVGVDHKREGHIGPISSTGAGGKSMNINNLNSSQLRGLMNMSPYGISSRCKSGMKAQVIVNDDSNNSVVGVYDPKKPDVDIGETMLYSDGGCKVYLDKHGNITMSTSTASISIGKDGSAIDINGNVNITGTLSVNGVAIG